MKRIFSLLFALLLLTSVPAAASAGEIPAGVRNGKLTIIMECGGAALDGGSLSAYQVADLMGSEGSYRFEWIEVLQPFALPMDDLEDPALISGLARHIDLLTEISAPIRSGAAAFLELEPGLYLVAQSEADATEGVMPIGPFLISLPQYEDGVYHYDVTAKPKVPTQPKPPEPTQPTSPSEPDASEPGPTPPDGPDLPQTGQLNWPVPIMAVCGMLLFMAGWALRFGRKKENYEK